MSDSTDDEQPAPKRICASNARSLLGATEKILSTLTCQLKTNPHYRCAAPMRLYDIHEVEEAVQKAEADKQYRENHRETIEAQKLAKQKEVAKQKADTAAQACAQFSKEPKCTQDFTQGSHQPTKLPLDVWGSILKKLCPTALSALEAPSTIARHIVNAQLICRESCAASGAAWAALAALIQADHHVLSEEERISRSQKPQERSTARMTTSAPCRNMSWEESVANPLRSKKITLPADMPWDQVVSNPLSLKNDVLKEACRSVGEQVSGTKAVLVLRLLKFFGVDRPCAVPAVVLLSVKHEKVLYSSTQLNQDAMIRFAVEYAFPRFTQTGINYGKTTMFAVRKVLASHFQSVSHLLQYVNESYVPAPKPQSAGKSYAGNGCKKRKRKNSYMCGCGNQPAPTCQQGCCKNCCRGPCARHGC